jgi:hypothetical protein
MSEKIYVIPPTEVTYLEIAESNRHDETALTHK